EWGLVPGPRDPAGSVPVRVQGRPEVVAGSEGSCRRRRRIRRQVGLAHRKRARPERGTIRQPQGGTMSRITLGLALTLAPALLAAQAPDSGQAGSHAGVKARA